MNINTSLFYLGTVLNQLCKRLSANESQQKVQESCEIKDTIQIKFFLFLPDLLQDQIGMGIKHISWCYRKRELKSWPRPLHLQKYP